MATALNVLRWLCGLFYTFVGLSWFGHRLLGRPWQTPRNHRLPSACWMP